MGRDSENLLNYIKLRCDDRTKISFKIDSITGIDDIRFKIHKLLPELKNENAIEDFSIDTKNQEAYVKLYGKVKAEKESVSEDALHSIHESVMKKFINYRYKNESDVIAKVELFSDLFKLFVKITDNDSKVQDTDNLFKFIVDKIHEKDGENYIKILGPDGMGKSTFLCVLYMYLYNCYEKGEIAEYPFYINLHFYENKVTEANDEDELNEKVKAILLKDLEPLRELSEGNEKFSFILIIDGNAEYERFGIKPTLMLQNIKKRIKGHKKIICFGQKTNLHSLREINQVKFMKQATDYTFRFSPIYINKKEKWKEVIEKYCKIINRESQSEKINRCIDSFKIKEIDHNLLTVFGEVCDVCDLKDIYSISDLYYNYCAFCLDNREDTENSLSICADMAYKYFMTTEFIEHGYIAKNWEEWELVHQNKTISNYLLAYYYSGLLTKGGAADIKPFECVFTNGINVFLKSIMNESHGNRDKTINFCELLFEKGDYMAQAQAAYLIGRIQDEELHGKAKMILNIQYKKLKERKDKTSLEEKRKRYFLKRSILVSMLYLGDWQRGEELLSLLLEDSVMNEVNRAFYLQYYDDIKWNPQNANLEDCEEAPYEYTISVLFNYVNKYLEENNQLRKQKNEFQIHLFTLCSIIQIRMKRGIENGILVNLGQSISDTLNKVNSNLKNDMKIYLQMLNDDIDKENYGNAHLYDELYRLKSVKRRGWTEKIEKGSIGADEYENVVEHIYYAWLLGMLYLPDVPPEEEQYRGYNKKKILDCILVHDLAETYVGDKMPVERNLNYISSEREYMEKIFMHHTYHGIGNMRTYKDIWRKFDLNSVDINGVIAKEMDIIQAIYQFYTYESKGAVFDIKKEKEWVNEENRLVTNISKAIYQEVIDERFKKVKKEILCRLSK